MADDTTASAAERKAIPLRKRPMPDQIEYLVEKLAVQLDVDKLPRDTVIVMGAAIVNLGAIATEVRALLNKREELRVLSAELQAATADDDEARTRLRDMADTWMDYSAEVRNATTGRVNATQTRLCAAQDAWMAAGLSLGRVAEEGGEPT